MDSNDATRLTEFPPYETEAAPSGVTGFLNKFIKPFFSSNVEPRPSLQEAPAEEENPQKDGDSEDTKVETGSYAVELEDRSLPNVLQRISSLVALGSGAGTKYADTELARYWMPDDISRECYECGARFSTLRRRHHCRICGHIFCTRCCSQRVPGHMFGCAGGLRVCTYCCNVVLSYLRENEMSGDITPDLKTLQDNLQAKFPDNKSSAGASRKESMFAREQEGRCDRRPTTREPPGDLYRRLVITLPTQMHRYRLVRYHGVWRGCDILQWVMDNTEHKTRALATLVCQNLLTSGYIESSTDVQQFADYGLYSPLAIPESSSPEDSTNHLVESSSSYCLDLNLGENSARLTKASNSENKTTPTSDVETSMPVHHNESHNVNTESRTLNKAMSKAGEEHLKLLLRQYLARECLAAHWVDVLYPLCEQAAESVHIDMYASDIDIRNYVQIKKVTGGEPKDSCVIQGTVLTKNVSQKGMPLELINPSVLILDCSITYQRVEGKVVTLEPILMQEQQYLCRCAARVVALGARVVLARGTAAGRVQDILRSEGIALAIGVREKALQRAARCTKADVVTSIDARIGQPRLGTCKNYYILSYPNKTLMVLENGPESQLGCCILLRGASLEELDSVKKVVKFMLLACYNWQHEKALLCDIEAVIPKQGISLDDDDESLKRTSESDTKICESISLGSESDSKICESKLSQDDSGIHNSDTESGLLKDNQKETLTKSNKEDISVINDPLTSNKYFKKTESDKSLSNSVPIQDFSDPLRSSQLIDDDVFQSKDSTVLKTDSTTERWSCDDVVLSMQPFVILPQPYLETEAGRKCKFRKYFPDPLFKKRIETSHTPKARRKISKHGLKTEVLKELHPFLQNPLRPDIDELELQASLAHFRAVGPYVNQDEHEMSCPLYTPPSFIMPPAKSDKDATLKARRHDPLDPLDPENHQQLNVLLYSFSNKSPNVPDFCVNPWVVSMEMYGRRDITLGAFLENYCFNAESKCPSQNCNVPLNQHVRKFVHGDMCVTVTCNTVGHSSVDKANDNQTQHIVVWSRCPSCGVSLASRRVSARSLRGSLAARLARELRRRSAPSPAAAGGCDHRRTYCYTRGLTTAAFRCEKIQTFDINLPPDVIYTNYDTNAMRESLINQLNELMLKGHETFTAIPDPDAEKDHLNFKQHIEQIHVALTSTALQEQNTAAGVVKSLWSIYDKIIYGEEMRRDAHDKWASPPPAARAAKSHPDTVVEEKHESDDAKSVDSLNDGPATDTIKDEIDRAVGEEDEEKGDKKTVRQILSQLLSKQSHQNGVIITSGQLPVLALAGEVGSVIAATLASVVTRAMYSNQSVQVDSDSSTGKERNEADRNKARSNEHIEVLLKEGLICRVYYAHQFHKLRHMLLSPLHANKNIRDEFAANTNMSANNATHDDVKDDCDSRRLCSVEEGFIRSLAHCVPWAARGGKSGSTFCKTKDDRFVLKEMSRTESQQFLEFAPHYFNYVVTCRQNNQPSILARILGVFGVGGVGNSLLVMENVFYGLPGSCARFDLKGSSRHRLTAPNAQVLMDQNLLLMRWQTQFYVQSHVGSVLRECLERDTQFLATQCVMDYSLLLAVDGNTLTVGIIDYIRTFTWDKRLEHLVKKNLGSGSPTVLSPEQYRARFLQAANKYVMLCPQHWDHLVNTKWVCGKKDDGNQ